jgi:hypothetical protein
MNHYSPLRVAMLLTSTTFSIIIIMLFFNIITVDELALILKLGKTETRIIQSMLNETRNITNNILRVLSQVIEHLFGWAGVDNVNLDVINIDLHEGENPEINSQNSDLKINAEDCPEGSQKCSKDNN